MHQQHNTIKQSLLSLTIITTTTLSFRASLKCNFAEWNSTRNDKDWALLFTYSGPHLYRSFVHIILSSLSSSTHITGIFSKEIICRFYADLPTIFLFSFSFSFYLFDFCFCFCFWFRFWFSYPKFEMNLNSSCILAAMFDVFLTATSKFDSNSPGKTTKVTKEIQIQKRKKN